MSDLGGPSEVIFQPDLLTTGIKTFATLFLVVGALILVLYFFKKLMSKQTGFGRSQVIEILASYHLAPKQRVAVIDVAGEKLIIGITQENITCLGQIQNEASLKKIETSQNSSHKNKIFKRLLSATINSEKKDSGGK